MANIRKSFNFRNGVQVDDDNFIVNANGLVGIGTSIPTEFLDVHGTAKVTGLVTATNLTITGVSTFYSDVKIGSGIDLYASTGIVSATAFYGDATNMTGVIGVAVDGWIVNAGNLSTTSKVGIGTTLPYHSLQVGQNPLTGNGFSVDAITGNVNTTGIITSPSFSGILTGNVYGNIESIGVSTFSTLKVGTGVTISGGIVTATNFVGSLTGTATTTTNIPNLTGAITSNNTTTSLGSFTSAQLATALSDETGNGANVFATSPTLVTPTLGNATATSIIVGGGVTITSAGIFAPTGIITAPTFVGGLVGIASTARDLTSNARVNIADIQSQTSSIGISTVSTRLYAESIGVGTNSPSGDIHIRKTGTSRLQVTSNTAEAIVAVGRSTTLNQNNGALIFGNTAGIYPYSDERSLDIVNYDTGSLNHYLHYGISGVGTGNFNWIYGQDANNPLMSLTYQGNLGIGVTNPTNKLQVSGSISASSLTLSESITANGNISATGAGTSVSANILYVYGGKYQILNSDGTPIFPIEDKNLNITSGISTFIDINIKNSAIVDGNIGIGTTTITSEDTSLYVVGNSEFNGNIGIGTTTITNEDTSLNVVGNSEFYGKVGIGTTNPKGILDLFSTTQPLYLPRMTTAQRNLIVGISSGAVIFNTSVNEFQGYTGTAWQTFGTN